MTQVYARVRFRRLAGAAALALPFVMSGARPLPAVAKHEFQVSAHKYAYRVVGGDRAELHVREGEVVHIVFAADDIPHSFTIDAPYRIDKRASPGKPVTFDFLADKPGTFEFYCNLAVDDRCRKEVRGTLIVDPR
jgi:heme/copper-type cytochrome/quinol oxidase subunit 2